MGRETARERLARAAFELFDEQGYERTTVDEIAERAGAGRTTFFRHYRSKDDVIFPDHDRMIEQVTTRLATSDSATALVAVAEAVRQVLLHYVGEGDLARRRYALTSKVPALRDREIASVARYQRVFREFIAQWIGGTRQGALRAELMAAAVVSAHNHVLRRWLRGECTDPVGELDDAMREVTTLFAGSRPAARPSSRSPPTRTSTRCSRRCAASSRTARRERRTDNPQTDNPPYEGVRRELEDRSGCEVCARCHG
ncbi:TetR/AcrR family transcriptional regulator [Actinacidiphila sp. DG2A-62]|uniref:TetR/AcrR family transcriptional regulator n=1 Tax=Actinacidiphila sp. DG2A-62 TaxID=3108821 RepID=UPI003FA3C5DE